MLLIEHIGLSPLTGNRVACKPSAISDHLLLHEDNNSSFNNFSILCCENNAYKLSLRESVLIKKETRLNSTGMLAQCRFCYSINYCITTMEYR